MVAAALTILFRVQLAMFKQVFHVHKIFNSHSSHVWPEANPNAASVHYHQQRSAVNVWAGIVHDFLIRPCLLPRRLRAHIYWVFVVEKLPEMLGENPLALRRNMWFQHDGAADYFARQVREHLTATYNDRWIGRGWSVAWPPMSPDLTPVGFFLWGHIKFLIFTSLVDSEGDLIARIVKAAATSGSKLGIFECTRRSLLCRCWLCIEIGGRTFEHLL